MRKPFPLLAAALCLAAFTGCFKNDALLDPNLEGSATITVLDAVSGAPVAGMRVEILGGDAANTSAEGQAVLEGARVGQYQVRLSKQGYETSLEPLLITSEGSEEVVALSVVATYRAHKKGPTLKGRVLLHPQAAPDTSATIGAGAVSVELRLAASGTGSTDTEYGAPIRTVKTDTSGYYTFTNVPEASTYAVAVPEFSRNGKTYSQAAVTVSAGALTGSQVFKHANSVLTPLASGGTLQVFARSLKLAANQPWVLEFSGPVDTSRFAAATAIQLRSGTGAGATNINSTRTWSQGFQVLSLRPLTGTWSSGTAYSVVLTGVRDSTNRLLATTTLNTSP